MYFTVCWLFKYIQVDNGKEATVNRALDGSMYTG